MVVLRSAKISDFPGLLSLVTQLGYPATEAEFKQRLSDFLDVKGHNVAIACDKDKIVGLIAWSQSRLFVSSTIRFRVEALVVDESYRGQGVGQELMQYLEEIVRALGETAIIDLTTGIERVNEGTHDFYKDLGYYSDGKIYLKKEVKLACNLAKVPEE
jgi:GNAT superfamily N-acetyltransferase